MSTAQLELPIGKLSGEAVDALLEKKGWDDLRKEEPALVKAELTVCLSHAIRRHTLIELVTEGLRRSALDTDFPDALEMAIEAFKKIHADAISQAIGRVQDDGEP